MKSVDIGCVEMMRELHGAVGAFAYQSNCMANKMYAWPVHCSMDLVKCGVTKESLQTD
jgi:hypothetical protein